MFRYLKINFINVKHNKNNDLVTQKIEASFSTNGLNYKLIFQKIR